MTTFAVALPAGVTIRQGSGEGGESGLSLGGEMRRQRLPFLNAYADGELVGTFTYQTRSNTNYVRSFYVAPNWRRRGVGRALLSELASFGKWIDGMMISDGFRPVWDEIRARAAAGAPAHA